MYGRSDHHLVWREKWGFEFDFYKSILEKKLCQKSGNFILRKTFPDFLTSLETNARTTFSRALSEGKRYSETTLRFFENDPKYNVIKTWN